MDEKTQKTKANTPAQGAGSTGASEETTSEKKVVVLPESTPEWLKEMVASGQAIVVSIEDFEGLIKSNEAVVISNDELIASNQKVVDSIEVFKEKGGDMIKAIVNSAKGISIDESLNIKEKVVLEVNPDAEYIVSKGKKFQDSQNSSNVFTEGQKVTHIGVERLTVLLNQGFIEEADEEESDD